MTIQRTREIFGKKMIDYSDQQVRDFIEQTGLLCDDLLSTSLHQLTIENGIDKRNTTSL